MMFSPASVESIVGRSEEADGGHDRKALAPVAGHERDDVAHGRLNLSRRPEGAQRPLPQAGYAGLTLRWSE